MKGRALKILFLSMIVFTPPLIAIRNVESVLNVDDLPTKNCEYSSEVARTDEVNSVEPLVWVSPDGSLPTMFNETERHIHPFRVELKYQTDGASFPRIVFVLVDSSIYGDIETSLSRYVTDVESSGFSVSVYSGTWGTPEETRAFLQMEFSSNLTGCLLVGDIPEAWYEMDSQDLGHEEFPIDLYYMDLDGVWTDSDDDGIYDDHAGDMAPEIWVGRLKASTVSGDDSSQLNNYFSKNHRYRTGTLSVPQRALVYVDDDWVSWADEDNNALGWIYDETFLVKNKSTTNADDYKERLPQGYEWVHLRCHGWSWGHQFKIPVGVWDGIVSHLDYRSIDPSVLFYQFFVCSAARFTENRNLAGTCIFTDSGGLLAVGSTKVGSMLHFGDFYGPIAQGDNIGDAFKEWFIEHGESSRIWFYGLTILGDPLLKPLMSPPDHDIAILSACAKTLVGQGYRMNISVTVENQGYYDETFNVTAYADENVTIIGDEITIGMQNVTLTSGNSTTITFMWNTTGVVRGNYTISAYATPVPEETDTADNVLTDGVVRVVLPGDVNADGKVDFKDIGPLCLCYEKELCVDSCPYEYDVNGDGVINMKDIGVCCLHYGEECP